MDVYYRKEEGKGISMLLIKPNYEILTEIDGIKILQNIERAGRTCYKSEDKISLDSAKKFVSSIMKSGHYSVIEHESLSAKFICDRGVTHEMVRHRLAAFSQESTRYCNYTKDKFNNQLTFIIPPWTKIDPGEYNKNTEVDFSADEQEWYSTMLYLEDKYHNLINMYGWSAQQARSVLPHALKTEIVMTCNVREWLHVLKLRTGKAAHPQIIEVMEPLLKELQYKIPILFDGV